MPTRIMADNALAEIFAVHLALPSPAMRAFTGDDNRPYYIGRRGREQKVDIYGDVVARSEMRGGDFQHSHEELKILFYDNVYQSSGSYRNCFSDFPLVLTVSMVYVLLRLAEK